VAGDIRVNNYDRTIGWVTRWSWLRPQRETFQLDASAVAETARNIATTAAKEGLWLTRTLPLASLRQF
jgi:hypothetical protein